MPRTVKVSAVVQVTTYVRYSVLVSFGEYAYPTEVVEDREYHSEHIAELAPKGTISWFYYDVAEVVSFQVDGNDVAPGEHFDGSQLYYSDPRLVITTARLS